MSSQIDIASENPFVYCRCYSYNFHAGSHSCRTECLLGNLENKALHVVFLVSSLIVSESLEYTMSNATDRYC